MNPRIFLFAAALALALVNYAHRSVPPQQQLPLVHADYPVCVTVKPGTLEPRKGANLYPRQKDVA